MSEKRAAKQPKALWPPFSPDPRLMGDMEKGRSKKELEAIIREAARRRDEDTEAAPEKRT